MSLSNIDSLTANNISEKSSTEKLRSITNFSTMQRLEIENTSKNSPGGATQKIETSEKFSEDESFGNFEFAVPDNPKVEEPISKIEELKNMTLKVTYDNVPAVENLSVDFSSPLEHEITKSYETSIDLLADLDSTTEIKSDDHSTPALGKVLLIRSFKINFLKDYLKLSLITRRSTFFNYELRSSRNSFLDVV